MSDNVNKTDTRTSTDTAQPSQAQSRQAQSSQVQSSSTGEPKVTETRVTETKVTESKTVRRKARPKWILPALIAASLGITAFALLRPQGPTALPVTVVSATTDTLVKSVNGTGTAKAEVSRTLSFPAAGNVTGVRVKVGDEVTEGQELARLDTANTERDLAAARASVVSAEADLNRAQAAAREGDADRARQVSTAQAALVSAQAALNSADRTLRNQQNLLAVGGVSVQAVQDAQDARNEAARKLDAARSDVTYARSRGNETNRAAITQAQAALESANVRAQNLQQNLTDAVLYAPVAGVVSAVNVTTGNPAPTGQSAVEITEPGRVYLEVPFDETRAAGLQVGQPATVQFDALPTRTLQGTVSRVDPVARSSGQVASVNARIRLPDASEVKPGFTATATVITRRVRNAVVIPLETTSEENGKTRVWRVTPGTVQNGKQVGQVNPVDITVVERTASQAAVDGLRSGDLLLTPAPAPDAMKAGQDVSYAQPAEKKP